MRPKSLILLALALGCGLVASIGISQVMDKSGEQQNIGYETAPIYVALHNINLNDPIDASMVALQDWPKDKIPQGAISELANLEGRRPRTLIVAGDAILEAKLLQQGEVHDPIGEIPPGMRLKTISVDAQTSAAGLLNPGDRVDVQFFMTRSPGGGSDSARMKVILQNIRIYAIDQTVHRGTDGSEGRAIAKTVSLLLTPEQANRVSLAEQMGKLSLIPRSPDDEATTNATELTWNDLWDDKNSKNTRAQEQLRDSGTGRANAGTGFLSDLMGAMKKAADERPPFVMEIVEAEDVRQMEFDPFTGKPIRGTEESKPRPLPTAPAAPKPAGGSTPDAEVDLGEEFGGEFDGEFPIELE